MQLDLRAVIEQPGAAVPFSYRLHLPDMDFPFGRPFAQPIDASGRVKNTAGLLTLEAVLSTTLHLTCDRCVRAYTEEMALPVVLTLAETLTEETDDEILPVQGDRVDLDEALIPPLILSMETKHLCFEDCRGLCPRCGHDLNDGPCKCPREIDPRLSALQAYFVESNPPPRAVQ